MAGGARSQCLREDRGRAELHRGTPATLILLSPSIFAWLFRVGYSNLVALLTESVRSRVSKPRTNQNPPPERPSCRENTPNREISNRHNPTIRITRNSHKTNDRLISNRHKSHLLAEASPVSAAASRVLQILFAASISNRASPNVKIITETRKPGPRHGFQSKGTERLGGAYSTSLALQPPHS